MSQLVEMNTTSGFTSSNISFHLFSSPQYLEILFNFLVLSLFFSLLIELSILSSYKSLTATTSVFGIPPKYAKCPLPLAPTPINATLILFNFGAEKSPMYIPSDAGMFSLQELAIKLLVIAVAAVRLEFFINFRLFIFFILLKYIKCSLICNRY